MLNNVICFNVAWFSHIRLCCYWYNSDIILHQKEQGLLFVRVVYQRDVNSQFWAPLRPIIFVLFVLWLMLRQSQRQNVTQLVFPGRKQLDRRSVGAKPNCHVLSLHCLSCVMCIRWLLIRRQMLARQLWASSDSQRVWGECLPTEICLENHAGKKRSNWKTRRERKWEMSLSVFEEPLVYWCLVCCAVHATHSLCHWLTTGRQHGCLCHGIPPRV